MTDEEAIAVLKNKYIECKSFYDLSAHPENDYPGTTKFLEALQMGISAIRQTHDCEPSIEDY